MLKGFITISRHLRTDLGKGSKKKVWKFPIEGGVPENFENFSQLFLFIFKHGLNHPKMKRIFFSKVRLPPPSPSTSRKFPTFFFFF